jgi:hypothetical protein
MEPKGIHILFGVMYYIGTNVKAVLSWSARFANQVAVSDASKVLALWNPYEHRNQLSQIIRTSIEMVRPCQNESVIMLLQKVFLNHFVAPNRPSSIDAFACKSSRHPVPLIIQYINSALYIYIYIYIVCTLPANKVHTVIVLQKIPLYVPPCRSWYITYVGAQVKGVTPKDKSTLVPIRGSLQLRTTRLQTWILW